jgi:hypothetical protein
MIYFDDDNNDDDGPIGGMNDWQRKSEYSEKTCLIAALSAIRPT